MATERFRRVSETPEGDASSAAARQPTISGDGRSVAFVPAAANLYSSLGATDGRAYVHARRLDAALALRVSLSVLGVREAADMRRPAMTYSGGRVTFDSAATNLVLDDSNGDVDILQRPMPSNFNALFYLSFE